MRSGKLFGAGPLHVIDDMTAVLTAVQVDRNETGLGRHKARALDHQLEDLFLVIGGQLDHVNLRANAISAANLGHG